MASNTLISIVIPTRSLGENPDLDSCLDSLSAQDGLDDVEVILVNDAGKKRDLKKDYPLLNLEIVELKENMGVALALNQGIKKAKGEIIAILDDDSVPAGDWLINLKKAWETNKFYDGICGVFIYNDDDSLASKVYSDLINWYVQLRHHDGSIQYACQGNSSYKRKILDITLGHKPVLGKYGGNDTDFSLRIIKSGGKLKVDENLKARHCPQGLTPLKLCRKYYLFGKAARIITNTHPWRQKTSILDYIHLYKNVFQNKTIFEKPSAIILLTLTQFMTVLGYFNQVLDGGE